MVERMGKPARRRYAAQVGRAQTQLVRAVFTLLSDATLETCKWEYGPGGKKCPAEYKMVLRPDDGEPCQRVKGSSRAADKCGEFTCCTGQVKQSMRSLLYTRFDFYLTKTLDSCLGGQDKKKFKCNLGQDIVDKAATVACPATGCTNEFCCRCKSRIYTVSVHSLSNYTKCNTFILTCNTSDVHKLL